MFNIGDVVHFESEEAGKKKYHLCISLNLHFLFINSPKNKSYPGDFAVPATELPFLPAGHTKSIISCTQVMLKKPDYLRQRRAKKVGELSAKTMKQLFDFICECDTISEDEREQICQGLADYL